MNIVKTVETRITRPVNVFVANVATVGNVVLLNGAGRVKVTRLAKGGYSIRVFGKGAERTLTYFTDAQGTNLLRVDADVSSLSDLFR